MNLIGNIASALDFSRVQLLYDEKTNLFSFIDCMKKVFINVAP
jgi:hypothetical protein